MKNFIVVLFLGLLVTSCGQNPIQSTVIGERLVQDDHLVEVKSSTGAVLTDATIIGKNVVLTNEFGLAHVQVDSAGSTTILASAPGFRSKEFKVIRPALTADDALTLIRLDPSR